MTEKGKVRPSFGYPQPPKFDAVVLEALAAYRKALVAWKAADRRANDARIRYYQDELKAAQKACLTTKTKLDEARRFLDEALVDE